MAKSKSQDRVVVGPANGGAAHRQDPFTSGDPVREVIHNFKTDGIDSLD